MSGSKQSSVHSIRAKKAIAFITEDRVWCAASLRASETSEGCRSDSSTPTLRLK